MGWSQDGFDDFTIEGEVFSFSAKGWELNSGEDSKVYANWRPVTGDVVLLEVVSNWVIDFMSYKGIEAETVLGIPSGATVLGTEVQKKFARRNPENVASSSVSVIREVPKEHGDPGDKYFSCFPKGRVVLLEDVTTTGRSLFEKGVKRCREAGVEVVASICLMNRMQIRSDGRTVEEFLKDEGVDHYSMSSAPDLIPKAYARTNFPADEARVIEDYLREHKFLV